MIRRMILTGLCALTVALNVFAQVGIYTETPKTTLDVRASKTDGSAPEGIIAPRLTGDELKSGDANYGTDQNGAVVYATAAVTATTPKTIHVTRPGYYYYDALNSVWMALSTGNDAWFYMPSFNLPLGTTLGASQTFNLYKEYDRQFQQSGNTLFMASPNAIDPTKVMSPYAATQLDFFVTDYSTNVITVTGLDDDGTLHYTVNALTAPDGSYINVIFKVR